MMDSIACKCPPGGLESKEGKEKKKKKKRHTMIVHERKAKGKKKLTGKKRDKNN